jgi:hypothetical protein
MLLALSTPGETNMNLRDQWICLWLVPVFGIVIAAAFYISGFVPPLSPTLGANEVAEFYRTHLEQIRAGMITVNLCGVMFIPFYMVITVQMMRMGTPTQAFAFAYLSAAASAQSIFVMGDLFWSVAAFRPERDPNLTLLLNDLAWMAFVSPVGFIMAQNIFLALGIYFDKRPKPVFPRWAAHLSLLAALLMAPGAFSLMYKTGPLAWDGVLSFDLRVATFAIYIAVMFFVVRSALLEQQREMDGAAA